MPIAFPLIPIVFGSNPQSEWPGSSHFEKICVHNHTCSTPCFWHLTWRSTCRSRPEKWDSFFSRRYPWLSLYSWIQQKQVRTRIHKIWAVGVSLKTQFLGCISVSFLPCPVSLTVSLILDTAYSSSTAAGYISPTLNQHSHVYPSLWFIITSF